MKVEQELIQWEELTASGLNESSCICERQDAFVSAWELSKRLVQEERFYLSYTSSFCLFQISTYNLVNTLIQKQEIDLAYDVFEEARYLLDALIANESLAYDIKQHIIEERNELYNSNIFIGV
jgi:hypothetical protein